MAGLIVIASLVTGARPVAAQARSFVEFESGQVRLADGQFRSGINNLVSDSSLRALASTEGPLTYTCAPPGSGTHMGIDRDSDPVPDGVDNCPVNANTNQADSNNNGLGNACDAPPGC